MTTKLGLTLPSFVEDPEIPIGVARAAEDAGLDAVFVFDHLFRRGTDGRRRPALEATALLGAVAAETTRITVGVLVARATLRPPAVLANALQTMARIAPGRVVAGLGAGDSESREENESFGLGFGTLEERVTALVAATRAARDHGFPVWIGGVAAAVRRIAATEADGWNRWGGDVDRFTRQAAELRRTATRVPFECSWSGLVALAADDARADEKAGRLRAGRHVVVGGPRRMAATLRAYADAGAEWLILGPLDSRDPVNAKLLGGEVGPLLRA